MTETDKTTNWPARRAALIAADGAEWDRLSEAFDADWKAAYCSAFRARAQGRGWSDANIDSGWLDGADDALIEHGDRDPAEVGAEDVIACEVDAANA